MLDSTRPQPRGRRRAVRIGATLLLAGSLLPGCASAQDESPPTSTEDLAARADTLVAEHVDGDGPGVAVLVVRNGEVVLNKGYGLADVATKRPITPDTSFYLASVSKQFTAAGVMLLVQRDELSLTDSIRDFFPELPEAWEVINIQQLLTHTSGLPDHFRFPEDLPGRTNDDVVALMDEHGELDFDPGSQYRYSNSGYVMLSMIVGMATDRPYSQFMREEFFEPLGMEHTLVYDESEPEVHNPVQGYVRRGTADVRPVEYELFTTGAGGMFSTLDDFVRWDAALNSDRVLNGATRAVMLKPRVAMNADGRTHYGFGWSLSRVDEVDVHAHSGGLQGYSTHFLRCPARKISVVLLSNQSGLVPVGALTQQLLDLYHEGPGSEELGLGRRG